MRFALPDTLPRELGSILQLKVRLLGVSPMVWRRLLVPSSYTLRELHGVIQVAMGWEATHLYRFFIRAVHYGSIELGGEIPDVTLGSFQFRKNAKFTYDYDMGDLWRHEIRVEGVTASLLKDVLPIDTVNSLPTVTPFSRPIVTPLGVQEWAYPRSA